MSGSITAVALEPGLVHVHDVNDPSRAVYAPRVEPRSVNARPAESPLPGGPLDAAFHGGRRQRLRPGMALFTTRVGDHRTEAGRQFLRSRSPLTFVERIQHGGHILGTRGRLHFVQKGGGKLRQHLCRHQDVSRQHPPDEVLRDVLLA